MNELLSQTEIKRHMEIKAVYPSYPALPRAFDPSNSKRERKHYKRLLNQIADADKLGNYAVSVLRGFKKRVQNWQKDHAPFLAERSLAKMRGDTGVQGIFRKD